MKRIPAWQGKDGRPYLSKPACRKADAEHDIRQWAAGLPEYFNWGDMLTERAAELAPLLAAYVRAAADCRSAAPDEAHADDLPAPDADLLRALRGQAGLKDGAS